MKIFKITIPTDYISFDCFAGFIIVAETKEQARKLAISMLGQKDRVEAWEATAIEKIGSYEGERNNAHVLLMDYRQ